jgi:hypothetical protein
VTFGPTYKYHLGCNVYSGDALPAGVAAVRAVDSSTSLADSEAAATEGAHRGVRSSVRGGGPHACCCVLSGKDVPRAHAQAP